MHAPCMRLCAHAYVCVCVSVCTYVRTLLLYRTVNCIFLIPMLCEMQGFCIPKHQEYG